MDALRTASQIDLRLLAIYMAVVESGGFSSAQISLNMGASSVSRSIADLEGRLGMRLCQRGRVGFRLTDNGRSVYEACQRVFTSLEAFRADMGGLRGQLIGELAIATIDNWVTDDKSPLAKTIQDFKAIGPDVDLTLYSLAPDDLEHTVMDGRAGIGIGVFHRHRPGLAYEALYDDPIDLYCGFDHPLYEDVVNDTVPTDLKNADLARRSYLSEKEVAPKTAHFRSTASAHQMEGVAYLILSGRHIGYLPVSYAQRWVDENQMISIKPEKYRLKTTLEIVTRRGAVMTRIHQAFLELLRENTSAIGEK